MPNNGALEYTPSDEVQTIPLGYTSGGTVKAMDITNSKDYENCLTLSEQILNIGSESDAVQDAIEYNYKELEYIYANSNDKQIDTGVIVDTVNEIVEVNMIANTIIGWEFFFKFANIGVGRTGWNENSIRFIDPYGYADYGCSINFTKNIVKFKIDNGHAYCDDKVFHNWTPLTNSTSTNTLKFFIPSPGGCFKLYGSTIRRDGTIIHNFIPVLKEINGKNYCGLFDRVTKEFKYNETATYEYKLKI